MHKIAERKPPALITLFLCNGTAFPRAAAHSAHKNNEFGAQESTVCEFCKDICEFSAGKLGSRAIGLRLSRAQALRHKYLETAVDVFPALQKCPKTTVSWKFHEFCKAKLDSRAQALRHKYAETAVDTFPALQKCLETAVDGLPSRNKCPKTAVDGFPALKSQPSRAAYEFLFARTARILSQGFALLTEFSCGKLVGLLKKHKNSRIFVTNSFPAFNKYKFGATNSLPSFNKHEFVVANSLPAFDKHEFVVTNSLPAFDKHEFVVTNSFPAFNKYKFAVTNSFPSFNNNKFGATNSFSALEEYKFTATNSISAYKKHKFVAQDESAGLSAAAASIKIDLLRFHARANGNSKTARKGCDKAWRKPCNNKRSIA